MSAEFENIQRAQALIRDAQTSYFRGDILKDKSDYSGAIEAYQHCIEISMKALYRVQGMDYPFEHDPTKGFDKVYEGLVNRSQNIPVISGAITYWKGKLARIRWITKISSEFHQLSMYAFCDISAKDFFNKEDADYIQRIAGEVQLTTNFFFSQFMHGGKEK